MRREANAKQWNDNVADGTAMGEMLMRERRIKEKMQNKNENHKENPAAARQLGTQVKYKKKEKKIELCL